LDDAASTDPERVSPDPPPLGRREVLHQRWDELAYFHWAYAVRERAVEVMARLDAGEL